jgi:hypothetical protein
MKAQLHEHHKKMIMNVRKTKFYLMTAIATILFASATVTASAQRGFGFPPAHRFFPAPVRIGIPAVSVRIGIPLPVPAVGVYAPGCGYAPGYAYAPAPVVVAGGFYRNRVVVDRRGSFGHDGRGFRR